MRSNRSLKNINYWGTEKYLLNIQLKCFIGGKLKKLKLDI